MADESDTLADLFPEPERPPTPPPHFAVHTRPGELKPKDISIRLVGSHHLWGHHLWNAGKCFANYLDAQALAFCKNKRILELGAGGALPSIISVLCGAEQVVITDYTDDKLLNNIIYNVNTNLSAEQRRCVDVQGHIWGKDVSPLRRSLTHDSTTKPIPEVKFDVIFLSDLIFNHSEHEALMRTCESSLAYSTSPSTTSQHNGHSEVKTPCLLVFYTHHRPRLIKKDLAFFDLARQRGWLMENIVTEKMEAMFKDDPGDEEVRATVNGWRLWRATTLP